MTQFTYEATREDFLRLNRMLYWRQLRTLVVFAIAALLLFVALPFIAIRPIGILESYRSTWGVLVLPALVGLMIVLLEWGARKRWRDAAEIRANRDYLIDEAGIHVTSATFNGFLAWEHLNDWKEAGGFLYLRTAQNQYYFFPFALVPDPAELHALIAAKVKPTAATKGKGIGYKVAIVWLVIVVVAVVIGLLPHAEGEGSRGQEGSRGHVVTFNNAAVDAAARRSRCLQRLDAGPDLQTDGVERLAQIVGQLHPQPVTGLEPGERARPQVGVDGEAALLGHDSVDALRWQPGGLCEPVGGEDLQDRGDDGLIGSIS